MSDSIAKHEMNTTNEKTRIDSSNTQDSKELKYEKFEVKETPFTIIQEPVEEEDRNRYMVTMGRYAMSEHIETFEEALIKASEVNWTKIMQVIHAVIEFERTQKTFEKTEE